MNLGIVGALLALLTTSTEAQTCLMMYQVADNGLEAYIQNDYMQLSLSPLLSNTKVRTWIYHDAGKDGWVGALPNTIDRWGNALTRKHEGSQYVHYNPQLGKLQVDTTLPFEVNSLAEDVIEAFLRRAMSDCIANGYPHMMAIFSSHAGGFIGFGEDLYPYKAAPSSNKAIATAVRNALQNTPGAPNKLEVLGFDACNMQAFGAAADYVDVAQYLLASEAEEPGHGWAYSRLDQASDTIELSRQIVSDFLTYAQGPSHAAPKTLSVLNLSLYRPFVDAFEALCGNLLSSLIHGDVSLHAFVSRARSSAVAFLGSINTMGSPNPTCLDIGSFLQQLAHLCNPSGGLAIDLHQAADAYRAMFVERGNGPGTPPGTGMHIVWPTQGDYNLYMRSYNQLLFQHENYISINAPNFKALLGWLLHSTVPTEAGNLDDSVCSTGAGSTVPGADPNALILADDMMIDANSSAVSLEVIISPAVTHVLVEYAVYFSPSLRPFLRQRGFEARAEDYLMLKGGEVSGTYQGSTFSSAWDQSFYFLNTTDESGESSLEALYVKDEGDTKWVPVIYFPESMRDTVEDFEVQDFLIFDSDRYILQGAAKYAYLGFSKTPEGLINHNLALYISQGTVFHEQPREAGGLLMPVIFVDGSLQGQRVSSMLGGFDQTVIEWSTTLDYHIVEVEASQVSEIIPSADMVAVNLYAFNAGDPDLAPAIRRYSVIDNNRGAVLPPNTDTTSDTPKLKGTSHPSEPTEGPQEEPAEEDVIGLAENFFTSSASQAGGFFVLTAISSCVLGLL